MTTAQASQHGPYATPPVLKYARVLGIDLTRVTPTGSHGRIRRDDVDRYVRTALERAERSPANDVPAAAAAPKADFSRFGPVERKPLSPMQQQSAAALALSWQSIPHVTNFDAADITDLEGFCRSLNAEATAGATKVTTLAFLVKCVATALRAFPDVNASLSGNERVLKRYVHIGIAADTPDGLAVPVVRDCDAKGVRELADEIGFMAAKAREGRLEARELEGGCLSVFSLGQIGGTGFTPIIHAPQIAALGVVRAETRPVWDGQRFMPRLMLPLSLSWDHRAIDGAMAARFLSSIVGMLGDLRRAGL